jgi:alanyl-tRNA synthetase
LSAGWDLDNASLNVIADHIRASAFLIADGVLPSRDGRGYVLRRVIRRAIRHGYKLGVKQPFFYRMVEPLAAQMGDAYPELRQKARLIADTLAKRSPASTPGVSPGRDIAGRGRALRLIDGGRVPALRHLRLS